MDVDVTAEIGWAVEDGGIDLFEVLGGGVGHGEDDAVNEGHGLGFK